MRGKHPYTVKMREPLAPVDWKGGQFGPPKWFRYYVQDGDNWQSVAARDGWPDPKMLIQHNFKTTVPEEVNWYIANYVDCDPKKSKDKINMSFHTVGGELGYIFTSRNLQPSMQPNNGGPVSLPLPEYDPDPIILKPDTSYTRQAPATWTGVGVKVAASAESGYDASIIELSTPRLDAESGAYYDDTMTVFAYTQRSAWKKVTENGSEDSYYPGSYGISGGIIVCVITGLCHPYQLEGVISRGPDFALAVGLSGPVNTLAKVPKIASYAKALRSGAQYTDEVYAAATKNATRVRNAFHGSYNYLTSSGGPTPYVFDTIGVGAEVGLYWGVTKFHVLRKYVHGEDWGLGEILW